MTRGDRSLQTWQLETHAIMIDISRKIDYQKQIGFMYRRMRQCTRKICLLCRQTVERGLMTERRQACVDRKAVEKDCTTAKLCCSSENG